MQYFKSFIQVFILLKVGKYTILMYLNTVLEVKNLELFYEI